ncbi:hypothetical protein [Microbacterium sp. LWH10-1.2]|uniref:hypothetical protein n=1 Tax=Microbacterium sp. LWH10-1.2 TaxID=3135255 RepID=UPI00313A1852
MTDDLHARLAILRAHLRPQGLLLIMGPNDDYWRVFDADGAIVLGDPDAVTLDEVEAEYLPK